MSTPSHGPWALLGIAPTRDARDIKRAYAARLKTVRPEDDPAGFQALRQAYEWALAQSGEQPAPAPVVYLSRKPPAQPAHPIKIQATEQTPPPVPDATSPPVVHFQIDPQAQPIYRIKIQATPQQQPPPNARTQPESWLDLLDDAPPPPEASPSKLGESHWNHFLASAGDKNEEDESDTRIQALAARLRAWLRHPDLVNFDAREAFLNAALSACADGRTPGALRLACDAVFDWSRAPMPLDPWARARWSGVIERIAGDRQYRAMQALAQDAEPRRWVLQQLTQSGPPEIPWHRFFDARFRNLVQDSLRRLQTDWPQALQFRLNAAALPILEEAAGRPWPNLGKPSKPIGFALALIPAVTLALIIAEPLPSRLIPGGAVLLFLAMWAAWRAAYPLWIIPALARYRQNSHRPHVRLAWYAVRMSVLTAAFFFPAFPPPDVDLLAKIVIVTVALSHLVLSLLLNGFLVLKKFLFAILFCAILIVLPAIVPGTSKKLYMAGFPVLMLSETLLFGLYNILQQVYRRTLGTRARLFLLACAVILVAPLQILLSSKAPALFVLLGWVWVVASCAALDLSGLQSSNENDFIVTSLTTFVATLVAMGLSTSIMGRNNPVTSIFSLQILVAGMIIFMLNIHRSYYIEHVDKR